MIESIISLTGNLHLKGSYQYYFVVFDIFVERGEGGFVPAFAGIDVGADVQEHIISHLAEGIDVVVEVVGGCFVFVY